MEVSDFCDDLREGAFRKSIEYPVSVIRLYRSRRCYLAGMIKGTLQQKLFELIADA